MRLLLVILMGCITWGCTQSQSEEDMVREAVFRREIGEYTDGWALSESPVICLAFREDRAWLRASPDASIDERLESHKEQEAAENAPLHDPPSGFVQRFVRDQQSWKSAPVFKAQSQCALDQPRVAYLSVQNVKLLDEAHATAVFGFKRKDFAMGATYELEKRDGKWVAVRQVDGWKT